MTPSNLFFLMLIWLEDRRRCSYWLSVLCVYVVENTALKNQKSPKPVGWALKFISGTSTENGYYIPEVDRSTY